MIAYKAFLRKIAQGILFSIYIQLSNEKMHWAGKSLVATSIYFITLLRQGIQNLIVDVLYSSFLYIPIIQGNSMFRTMYKTKLPNKLEIDGEFCLLRNA